MMITGRQIREARVLLGLSRSELALRVGTVTALLVMRAEECEDEPPISMVQADAMQRALERAGVDFTFDPPSVQLRKIEP